MPILLERDTIGFEASNSKTILEKHTDYLRDNWFREGLPYNWQDLEGTGFMIKKQVDLIFSETSPGDSFEERRRKIKLGLKKTEEDIKGFMLEYLAEGLVFPIFYKVTEVDGVRRIVSPLYGNKKMVDTVSSEERGGSVKKTLVERVEPFFLAMEDYSIAVMTSPKGPSGLRDEAGIPIVYSDSQTYIWQKRGRDIVGFTVRTDFSNREHRELLKRLGGDSLSEDSNLSHYVENVAFIRGSDAELSIKDIVDAMRGVRFRLSGGSLYAYKNRSWHEVYKDLERREELWRFDETTKRIVDEFKERVLSKSDIITKKEVQEALAVTILRVSKFLRGNNTRKRVSLSWEGDIGLREQGSSYGEILEHVRELPGCAGGGSDYKKLFDSITPRFGFLGEDEFGSLEFECPRCGKINVRPRGRLISRCQHCGSSDVSCEESLPQAV